jgi:hypothetical protein
MAVAKLASEATLLLRLGVSDESLYYQASIGAHLDASSFLIDLHETSLVLERLRMGGALEVSAQMPDGNVYRADLMLMNGAARLTLNEICDEVLSAPRLLPLT